MYCLCKAILEPNKMIITQNLEIVEDHSVGVLYFSTRYFSFIIPPGSNGFTGRAVGFLLADFRTVVPVTGPKTRFCSLYLLAYLRAL